VNLISNPDFIFDIRKSDSVDCCLAVIAGAFMDSCSYTEQKLTKVHYNLLLDLGLGLGLGLLLER